MSSSLPALAPATADDVAQALLHVLSFPTSSMRLRLPLYGEVLVESCNSDENRPRQRLYCLWETKARFVSVTFRNMPTLWNANEVLDEARQTNTTGFLWSQVLTPPPNLARSTEGSRRLILTFLPGAGGFVQLLPRRLSLILFASPLLDREVLWQEFNPVDLMVFEGVMAELGMKRLLLRSLLQQAVEANLSLRTAAFAQNDTSLFIRELNKEFLRVSPKKVDDRRRELQERVAREFFGPVLALVPSLVFSPP